MGPLRLSWFARKNQSLWISWKVLDFPFDGFLIKMSCDWISTNPKKGRERNYILLICEFKGSILM